MGALPPFNNTATHFPCAQFPGAQLMMGGVSVCGPLKQIWVLWFWLRILWLSACDKIAQNRVLWLFFKCPKCPFSTQELSPCDNYRPVTIFWPCPEVVTISDKDCTALKPLFDRKRWNHCLGQAGYAQPGPQAARKALRRYLFHDPLAWGSHHLSWISAEVDVRNAENGPKYTRHSMGLISRSTRYSEMDHGFLISVGIPEAAVNPDHVNGERTAHINRLETAQFRKVLERKSRWTTKQGVSTHTHVGPP